MERAGFKVAYLSGGALTSSLGFPDIELVSLEEVAYTVRKIREVTDLPLIVDADTGFGGPVAVYRSVRVLERAGAQAIQIEDQVSPKRCGHLEGKEVIGVEDMVRKIRSAVRARREALIVARTDARAVEGLDQAVERAKAYVEAGADIIFPEALTSEEEFREFSSKFRGAPLLANMTEFGKTPLIPAQRFREMGYKFVIFPVTLFRAAARAMEEVLDYIRDKGTQEGVLERLMTRSKQYEVIRYKFYQDLDRELLNYRPKV